MADTRTPTDSLGPDPSSFVDVLEGDALTLLKSLPEDSVDAVVTDPPYAIRSITDFASDVRSVGSTTHRDGGQQADRPCTDCGQPPATDYVVCSDCLDRLEVEAFRAAGMLGQQSQNWHEKATHSRGYADNDPQQFGRWCFLWLTECLRVLKPGGHLVAFGGTRTWHRLATAAEDAGFEIRDSLAWLYATGFPKSVDVQEQVERLIARGRSAGRTDAADAGSDFAGQGTALKPAHEPIVLARKPLNGTVAENVVRHGTGSMNIDATRLTGARWPSNVFLDDAQASSLDQGAAVTARPSRFFWVAKPDAVERVTVGGVTHPTVKPLALMQELIRLVTPDGGTVLDPFAGSGTTAEACVLEKRGCIAIEQDPRYLSLIAYRIARQTNPVRALELAGEELGLFGLNKTAAG